MELKAVLFVLITSGAVMACDSQEEEGVEFAEPPDDAREPCVEAAESLRDCEEPVLAAFYDECENDLVFGEDCADECATQIAGCYGSGAECQTAADIDSCVSSVVNFEACLCE